MPTCGNCHERNQTVDHIRSCHQAAADARPARSEPKRQPTPSPFKTVAKDLPDGIYTVVFEDESYRTLRVRRQPDDEKFMPGRQLISYLSGSNNEHDYTGFAHVLENGEVVFWKKSRSPILIEATKVLVGDPKAASTAYALRSGRCSRCNHPLTVPASLHAGLGPDCAKKRA